MVTSDDWLCGQNWIDQLIIGYREQYPDERVTRGRNAYNTLMHLSWADSQQQVRVWSRRYSHSCWFEQSRFKGLTL